jgi:CRISPR-associated protein Cas1
MGTLYIDRKDIEVRLDGQAIAFYSSKGREGTVPINPLKRVIVVGNVVIHSTVLHKLSRMGISVLFLSGRNMRFNGVLHGSLHNNGILRVRQYEKSLSPACLEIAVEIVYEKVSAQTDFIDDLISKRPDLRYVMTRALTTLQGVLSQIYSHDMNASALRGLEGSASAAYFRAYCEIFPPSLGFKKRIRRPPGDPVNALLSLSYTLLHYECLREIEITGLDPVIGFYHEFSYGRESLACDIVEPFRAAADRFVWNLVRERHFRNDDFEGDAEKGYFLKKDGRHRYYTLYEEWAKDMRPAIREFVRGLARRISDGQDIVSQ